MPRKQWTPYQRKQQSKKLKSYWRRVKELSKYEGFSLDEAKEALRFGIFKTDEVRFDASERVQDRWKLRRAKDGTVKLFHVTNKGLKPGSTKGLERAKHMATYNAMTDRLSIWTGLTRKEIRQHLAQYPQWREGVSPLLRKK